VDLNPLDSRVRWDPVADLNGDNNINMIDLTRICIGYLEYTSEVRTPKDKYKVGASGHMNIKEMGMGELDFEVTESLENEKLTYHVKKSGTNQLMGIVTLILEPVEGGTKFTYVFGYEMSWGIFGKFLDKLFGKRERKGGREMVKEVEEHSGEIDAQWNSNLLDASKQPLNLN